MTHDFQGPRPIPVGP